LIATITALRNHRAEHGIEPTRQLTVAGGAIAGLPRNAYLVEALANVRLVATLGPGPLAKLLVGAAELSIATSLDVPAERARLEGALADAANEAGRARAQLGQPGFVDRAPAAVVAKARERLVQAEDHQRRLELQLGELPA
ncbi:MAG: valine--tRNA ligase, partial [Chloroflexota bacterium]